MDESLCAKFREMAFEAEIETARANLAKKGASQDEIDDYIYSLRCIEELNNKYKIRKLILYYNGKSQQN